MRATDGTIPVVEEELLVGKTRILDGRVDVTTHTENVAVSTDVPLDRDEVEVVRVPLGVVVDVAPEIRTEGDVTIVPVVEERLFVEKRLVLVEEIRIRKSTVSETEHVEAVLRKQRATVERTEI